MKKNISVAAILFLSYSVIFGQISTGEEPVSFKTNVPALNKNANTSKLMPPLDMNKIEREDSEESSKGVPPRFGYQHAVNYDLENSGEWVDLPDGGKIWRLAISSPKALSINLLYDKFWLPDGAKFFVYSDDHKYSIGAVTSVNNKGSRENIQGFATGLIYGDKIILEYYLPENVKETGVISVAYVIHGYRYINIDAELKNSGSCNININCPQGRNWQDEKNAVALILVNGNRYCTGSLLNTTANIKLPYFLTADHCLGGWANNNYKYDAITRPDLNHWSFYWHYEAPGCINTVCAPPILSTVGATVVANNDVSDFALLRLKEDPAHKPGITPYYLGWDRSGLPGEGGVCIHHPAGDCMKISIYTMTPISVGGTHWRVFWSEGTTEGGSSGAPLLNSKHKVIGQLHRGTASCSNILGYDEFGKFSVSWTGNFSVDSRRRLSGWLDPGNTGVTVLNGSW